MSLISEIPTTQKFYGRNHELELLDQFVNEFERNSKPLFLLKGDVGIGKSTIVNHYLSKIDSKEVLYATVTFSGYESKLAYGALLEITANAFELLAKKCFAAFKKGLHQLNTNFSEDELSEFCAVFPRLRLYFNYGSAKDVRPDISKTAFFITELLKVINEILQEAKRKLIFYLDDLHGMDAETIKFLEKRFLKVLDKNIIWIGSVVDDLEVVDFWSDDSSVSLPMVTLNVSGLDDRSIELFLADNYEFNPDRKAAFIEIILQLTGGNPAEIKLLIPALIDIGVIFRKSESELWDYSLQAIHKIDKSNKILNYLLLKMDELSELGQLVISSAAVIGSQFNTAILSVITKTDPQKLDEILLACIDRLLIENVPEKEGGGSYTYRFMNEQIREAAYLKLTDEKKRRLHYTLGKTYLSSLGYAAREKNIFDIVNQFNECVSYFNSEKDRLELLEMNLQAGKKAKKEDDFDGAQYYFTKAIQLIESNRQIWDTDLVFKVYIESGETALLKSDYVSCVMFFESALKYTSSDFQKAQVHYHFLVMQNVVCDVEEAWKNGEMVLNLMKKPLPKKIGKFKRLQLMLKLRYVYFRKKLPSVDSWKLMEDPNNELIIATYMELIITAHLRKDYSASFILVETMRMMLRKGLSPNGYYLFTGMALLCRAYFRLPQKSQHFMAYAEGILARFPKARCRARILLGQQSQYNHYLMHVTSCREQLSPTFDVAVAAGEHGTAARLTMAKAELMLFEGQSLAATITEIESYSPFIKKVGNNECRYALDSIVDTLLVLNGSIEMNFYMGVAKRKQIEMTRAEVYYVREVSHLFLMVIMNEDQQAFEAWKRLEETEHRSHTILDMLKQICGAIVMTDVLKKSTRKHNYNKRLVKIQHEFSELSRENPGNFSFAFWLLKALIAESHQRLDEAVLEYHGAIASASKFQFHHFSGLIYERISVIYRRKGNEAEANLSLQSSIEFYRNYGALAKVNQLEKHY